MTHFESSRLRSRDTVRLVALFERDESSYAWHNHVVDLACFSNFEEQKRYAFADREGVRHSSSRKAVAFFCHFSLFCLSWLKFHVRTKQSNDETRWWSSLSWPKTTFSMIYRWFVFCGDNLQMSRQALENGTRFPPLAKNGLISLLCFFQDRWAARKCVWANLVDELISTVNFPCSRSKSPNNGTVSRRLTGMKWPTTVAITLIRCSSIN